jgi:hypothetical protein
VEELYSQGLLRHVFEDVVYGDVVAEDSPSVPVVQFEGGVPMNPMKDAFGRASRMWRAKPWLK